MNQPWRCFQCGQENKPGARECSRCGYHPPRDPRRQPKRDPRRVDPPNRKSRPQ